MPGKHEKVKECGFKTSIGGQALIEGILMRGPKKQAIVCRTADGLVEKVDELHLLREKYPFFGWPLIRGCVTFIDSMVKGMQALTYSASLVPLEQQEEPDKLDKWISEHFSAEKAEKLIIYVAVVLGIALSVFLFIFLPTFIVSAIKPLTKTYLLRNLSEGIVKVAILLGYMALVANMKDIRRLYQYHGAEHKCINCLESGLPLTVENARKSTRLHKRCGSSFTMFVMLVSIILFFFIRTDSHLMRVVLRILLIPVISGVSYEIIRLAGMSSNPLIQLISKPGLWMQLMTTKEPDDEMIRVGIASVEAVFDWKSYLVREFGYSPESLQS